MADAGNASDMTQMEAMGGGGSGGSQNLYTPPQLSTSGIAGTGGYVSQASQYISGMEAGTNLFNNWEAAQRGRMSYGEEQMSNMSSMGAMGGMQRGGPVRAPGYQSGGPVAMDRQAVPYLGSTTLNNGVNVSQAAEPGKTGYADGGAVMPAPDQQPPAQQAIPAQNAASPAPAPAQAPPPDQSAAPPPAAQQPQPAAPGGQPLHPSIADPNNPTQPAAPQTMLDRVVHFFAAFMHHRSLNDDGVPQQNGQGNQAIPGTPGEYDRTGTVTPHSLPPDYWDKTDDMIQTASKFAALAGKNPLQTYQALNAVRTSYTQSHMLRWLSVASRAQLDGNTDEMIQALKNANYYIPDGRNLNIQKGANGQVMYQDPVYPYVDAQGNRLTYKATSDAQPNMIPADQQYIQYVGQSLLNPMNVQNMIIGSRSAAAKQQQELIEAQGAFLRGQGINFSGQAALGKENIQQQLLPVTKYVDYTRGELNEAHANWFNTAYGKAAMKGTPRVTVANAQRAQSDAAKAFDSMSTGMPDTIPLTDQHGMTNPAGGRPFNNPAKIPTMFQGATPDQRMAGRSLAQSIAAANPAGVSSTEAADIAMRIVHDRSAKIPPTHIDPDTKRTVRDVVIDPKQNTVHVWVGNGWKGAYLIPNIISADEQGMPTMTGGESASEDDTAPAVEDHDDNNSSR